MFYSDEIIEEVRAKNDIVDLISSYVRLSKKGANYMGLCPFHGEKTPSFSVSPGKQIFHCFGCGAGGNVFTFLMRYDNMGFTEALKTLAERGGVALPDTDDEETKRRADLRTKIFEINKEAARFYYKELNSEHGKIGLDYLKKRGLTEQTIKGFGLGFSPKSFGNLYHYLKEKGFDDESLKLSGLFTIKEDKGVMDKFWNRVMFPIIDAGGRVIGFGGRVMGEGEPKYLNSPETPVFNKGRNLYGLNLAKHERGGDVFILCEGYMDVIALHKSGFRQALASLGTAFTREQAELIGRYVKTVILMYDSDKAGTNAVLKAVPILREAGLIAKVADLRPYKDPDEFLNHLGREEMENRLKNAMNSFYFELSVMEREVNMEDPAEKADLLNRLAVKLLDFENSLERETYLTAIADRYRISKEVLKKKVNSLGADKELKDVYKEAEDRVKLHRKEVTAEEGMKKSERLFLSWLTDKPELYGSIKDLIAPRDFSEPLYQRIATLLFQNFEAGTGANPARLISLYDTAEEQAEAAALFGETLDLDIEGEGFKKGFRETVLKIKGASLEREMSEAVEKGDMTRFSEIIKEQAALHSLRIEL